MKPRSKKIIISSVVVLALISGGYYFYSSRKQDETKVTTETIVVKRRDLINTVQTSGKVISNLDVEIKCKASGEIIKLPYDISDVIEKGALLLKLNPVDEQRNVRQAEINLQQSKSALIKAQQDLSLTRVNFQSTKNQAAVDLSTAQIKSKDLRTKAERSRQLYLLSTQRKLAVAAVDSARLSLKDFQSREQRAKALYQNNNLLSQNDYDTVVNQRKQAEIDLNTAELKLKEQDTNNRNEYETALTSARQAEADVLNAKLRLNQQNNSDIQLDIKNQDIKAAESRVEVDKIALLTAQQRLKDTEVYSPITGVVTAKTAQVGQIISSGISNVSGGTSVMTLSDMSRIFINASIDESDIGKIKLNQEASITVDAFPNERFKGEVMQISAKGNNVSNVVTFPVKIEVKSKNKKLLKPEMTSNVEVTALKKDNVLTVNTDSVVKNRNKYFVTVMEGQEKKQKEVKIGANNSEFYEIVSGLNEGDKIVIENAAGQSDSRWSQGGNNRNNANPRNITRNVRRVTGGGGAGGGGRQGR